MSLIKKIFNKTNTSIEPYKSNYFMSISPYIQDLLWIENGPCHNWDFSQITNETVQYIKNIKITISCSPYSNEPSLINMNLPISDCINYKTTPPGYFPCYEKLTPEQRRLFWEFLRNPFSGTHDISYVFIFYYGLERHLNQGNFEKAAEIVLKLRNIYKNKSFQFYSANALILASLKRKCPDIVMKLFAEQDSIVDNEIYPDLLLLYKFAINEPLSPHDIMVLAKSFNYKNTNYIKKYPEIFFDKLSSIMAHSPLFIANYLTEDSLQRIPIKQITIFANWTIEPRLIPIPAISADPNLSNVVLNLLQETHQTVKEYLKEYRKKEKEKSKFKDIQ